MEEGGEYQGEEGGQEGRLEKNRLLASKLVPMDWRKCRYQRTMTKFGPEESAAFFFSPGRCFLPFAPPEPAIGKQMKACKICRARTTGKELRIIGTGSATRDGKAARKRPAVATGNTWRAACETGVACRCTGWSCGGSEDLEEVDEAGNMVTESTSGMVAGGWGGV